MLITATIASSVGATLAAQVIRSPAQAIAESAPPPPSLLTAEVELRVLSDSVVLRGAVAAGQTVDVEPVVEGDGIRLQVVSRSPVDAGATLVPGQVIVEVSGRPVFVLPGVLPAYRDLAPGARGDDVAQLQEALRSLGHDTGGDELGAFGTGTSRALTDLYTDVGYEPPSATTEGAGPAMSDAPLLPAGEVVYLADFPARVDHVSTPVGAEVTGPVMTISAGDLLVRGSLQPHQRDLVRTGQEVQLLSELTGETAGGRVTMVAETMAVDGAPSGARPEQDGPDGGPPGFALVVTPEEPLAPGWAGQDVRLTVEAATTEDEVLVVPVSAISARANGEIFVQVVEPDGGSRDVRVTTGVTGDGSVEVRPVRGDGHGLTVGDEVVIGTAAGGGVTP
ncbi:peptidoglycan-binding protein [Streptomyces sp. 8K308]|nr:peptidoglycan-binding protein [Streptomyces sp. 8K308]